MKTLVIISHPTIDESLNQQFFKEASAVYATWHHLESSYPDGKIDIELSYSSWPSMIESFSSFRFTGIVPLLI